MVADVPDNVEKLTPVASTLAFLSVTSLSVPPLVSACIVLDRELTSLSLCLVTEELMLFRMSFLKAERSNVGEL